MMPVKSSTAPPRPSFVLETCIYARDLEAAERFYRDVLGLELHSRKSGRHVFFRCGQGMFLVFNPEVTASSQDNEVPPHGAIGPGHTAFAIPEEGLEEWRRHLQALGVKIEAEVVWPSGGRSLYFRDPAGNSIELATPRTWEPR